MTKKYTDKEWLQNEYSKIGNLVEIAEVCNVSYGTIDYWIKKFNIEKKIDRRMHSRTHTLNENYFKVIDDEHKAYWLGFIMADGCITQTDKKYAPNRFHFCLKKEECEKIHLELFLNDINSNYPIKDKLVENKKYSFESYIYELRINSKLFVKNLINNGIYMNKTGKEFIPETVPQELIRHFIRGFFDGDGSLTVKRAFRICSSSFNILDDINKEFSKIDVNFKIYKDQKSINDFYTIDSRKSTDIKKVLDYLYKDATIYLNRKYNRYIEYFK